MEFDARLKKLEEIISMNSKNSPKPPQQIINLQQRKSETVSYFA
jgi:hypothetical protein